MALACFLIGERDSNIDYSRGYRVLSRKRGGEGSGGEGRGGEGRGGRGDCYTYCNRYVQ